MPLPTTNRITPEALRQFQRGSDALHARVTGEVIDAIRTLYRRFNRNYAGLLMEGAISRQQAVALQDSQQIIAQLEGILIDSGLERVVAQYRGNFPDIARRSVKVFELYGLDASLAGIDAKVLDSLVGFSEQNLVRYVDENLLQPVRRSLVASTIGNRPSATVIDEILELRPELNTFQATVMVEDTYRQFDRFVRNEKAAEVDLDIVQYIGPNDSKTSEQCEFLLAYDKHTAPGFFYVDEVTADLHPDLPENPLAQGGHFNCRHDFHYHTPESAEAEGFTK